MAKGGFPGMGGANMQQLMKQAQKMQQDMQRMQQELQTREFTATVGGGAVRATAYGSKVIKSIEIALPAWIRMMLRCFRTWCCPLSTGHAWRRKPRIPGSSKLTGGMGLGF